MVDKQKVGERLGAAREALDWSQKDFAEAVDLTPQAWNNWEKGRQLIPPESAVKFCERFGLTLDFIYAGKLDALPTSLSKDISSRLKDNAYNRSIDIADAAEAVTNFSTRSE